MIRADNDSSIPASFVDVGKAEVTEPVCDIHNQNSFSPVFGAPGAILPKIL